MLLQNTRREQGGGFRKGQKSDTCRRRGQGNLEGRDQKSQEGAIHSFIGTLRAPTTHSRLLEIREGFMVEVTLEASPESYIGALHVEDRVEAFQTTPCRRECCFLEHRRRCTGDSSQWLQPSWG